jgi:hypothetical protein
MGEYSSSPFGGGELATLVLYKIEEGVESRSYCSYCLLSLSYYYYYYLLLYLRYSVWL